MRIPLFSWLFLMPICLLSISFCIPAVSGQCLGNQQSLLLQLKNSLIFHKDLSTKLVHWNQSVDCCSWEGVTCSQGRVIGLDLSSESIYGGLDLNSSSLFSLHYLQHLNLADNGFRWAYNDFNFQRIPSQFHKLKNLRYLNLSDARFTGQIPIEISHLTRLVTLDLSYNYHLKLENPNLNMLVQNLSELMELYLDRVNISAQGSEWCEALSSSLPNLRVLSMSYCSLSKPRNFSLLNLQSLSDIRLDGNNFSGQGSEWCEALSSSLPNLRVLSMSYCSLSGPLNFSLLNLQSLSDIRLDGNNFSGQGSEWCEALSSSLPNLRVLSMSYCSLSGPLNSSLLNLQSLSVIRLDGNNFSSPVPEFFGDFKNLISLSFSSSGLNGKFPEKIFKIPTLQELDFSGNELLQGSLPEFPLDGSLRTLILSGTNFSGTLPSSIGNLKMLSLIDLMGCNFSGEIPNSIANLTQLFSLDMSSNNFNGSIPSFSMGKNLIRIFFDNNDLTGPITSTRWEELLNLEILVLSYNSLEGSIPVSLFSLPSLRYLPLSNNRFSGPLNEFSNVSSYLLNTLDFSYNNLTGPIPMSIFELRGLTTLSLSSNNLEGPIPTSIFELRGLETLSLSSNKFSGSLQLNMIQQLKNLSELSLSDNNLLIEYTGPDSSLSSFPQMKSFGMASNKLKTFPDLLRNQSELEDLDLSDNQILGKIPNWIWKLPNLHTLNLSYNYLVTLDWPLLNISSLSFLDLRCNQLQGQLLVVPPSATYLDFSMNNFNFIIPANIGNSLVFTCFLSLSSNKFYGSIPGSICNATNLFVLDLSNNFLSGMVPQCLIEMSETRGVTELGMEDVTLGVLNLRNNNLTGTIYDVFRGNCGLQTLDLNGNQLEGKLPKSLAMCKKLEVLNIGNNHIKDAFPCYLKNIIMLRILVLRSNEFYGLVGCPVPNATWPMLQIVDLASNNFTGKLPEKYFSNWRAMVAHEDTAQFELIHHGFHVSNIFFQRPNHQLGAFRAFFNYQDGVTVTAKGRSMELVKILTIFTSIDLSCNNFEGPIPEDLGELKFLYFLNLSHNAFTSQIPSSLGKLSHLESLDLSNNELIGEIPVQLADGLTFLSVLNLSFNQLVGKIPQIKQFSTFSETSYEGNTGLCDFPLKEKCTHEGPGSSPPTIGETPSNSGNAIDWSLISVELGFVFGFATVVGPLMFWKKWRIYYYKHADDIFFKMLPKLYIRIENRRKRAHKNQERRAH